MYRVSSSCTPTQASSRAGATSKPARWYASDLWHHKRTIGQAMCLHQAMQLPGTYMGARDHIHGCKQGLRGPAVTAQFAHNAGCYHCVHCSAACSCSGQHHFDGAAAATSRSRPTAHRPAQPAEPATEGSCKLAGQQHVSACLPRGPFSGAGSCKPSAQQCVSAYLRSVPASCSCPTTCARGP